MIPDFTQAIFLKALEEWGAAPARFRALAPDEQADYLQRQGFASMHDVLAHAGVWWEEAGGIIRDTINKVERPRRKYDFDEFNAASLARFRATLEDEFMLWYETERQNMIELVNSLTDEQMKLRRVHGWLDAVTLFHLKEHGVGAPRFVVMDMLQREWVAYLNGFHALGADEQKAFLEKQGVQSFRGLLAHVAAWWEKALEAVNEVAKDPAYQSPPLDVDAFNADVQRSAAALDEADVLKQYESMRQGLIELCINLPDEVYNHKLVQDWLRSDVIEHYFDHAL